MATAKTNQPESEPVVAGAVAPVVAMTLTEFCTRLSETVRRPELIGAFESTERRAGRVKGNEAEFRQRYDDFVNKPVN